jgi:hypothetical protein
VYAGANDIKEPLMSARAISVMYTMAGLVPQAGTTRVQQKRQLLTLSPAANPVIILPMIIIVTLLEVAITIHPATAGTIASLIVFKRPTLSIKNPQVIPLTGIVIVITLATLRSSSSHNYSSSYSPIQAP